jgi:hypothetical protein
MTNESLAPAEFVGGEMLAVEDLLRSERTQELSSAGVALIGDRVCAHELTGNPQDAGRRTPDAGRRTQDAGRRTEWPLPRPDRRCARDPAGRLRAPGLKPPVTPR